MLLVWDLHITSKYKNQIIDEISWFIDSNHTEKNIVFLWDYVYHFIYDRAAILDFFWFLLKLYSEWKNLYVLAWNHDWIQWSFVFEEAKRSFDILNSYDSENKIKFITKPLFENIEWNNFLFLPFDFDFKYDGSGISDQEINYLLNSTNKNENLSWAINSYIIDQIKDYKSQNNWKKLFIFHHYYFESIEFPAQRWRFNFKDVALSHKLLDQKDVYFISGHLHQWFVHKNYFCVWSVWNSSPLEQNQFKFLYKFDPNLLKIFASCVYVNPYFTLEVQSEISWGTKVSSEQFPGLFSSQTNLSNFWLQDFETQIKGFYENVKSKFVGWYDVVFEDYKMPNLKDISVNFIWNWLEYDNIKNVVNEELLDWLKDVKIKKMQVNLDNVANMLDIGKKDLQNSLSDWKWLLKQYIEQKFPDRSQKYLDKLVEMKLL